MNLLQTIDVIDKIDNEAFKKTYYLRQIPAVIKGLAATEDAGKLWSFPYFKEKMSALEVDIYDNGNLKSKVSAHTKPDLKMKFGDYLTLIETNKPTDLRIFLFNFFKTYPELQKEFPCPRFFKGILDKIGYMFFGGKDTTVRIHYDIDVSNILLTHFGGKKKVVLFAPEYSELLYRLPFNTYSLIDLDKPDYSKYPGLAYVKGYECVLEDGDTVFIPSGYWHYITYMEKGFSISYRKMAFKTHSKMQGLINISVRLPFDKLMGKLWGLKWLTYKESVAEKKAEKTIIRLQEELTMPSYGS